MASFPLICNAIHSKFYLESIKRRSNNSSLKEKIIQFGLNAKIIQRKIMLSIPKFSSEKTTTQSE